MELKGVIADVRRKNGLSQEEFAKKLFVTRQAVSRWENGETSPGLETLKTIAETFQVPAHRLLNISETAVCQSCGMNLSSFDDFGTNADGTLQTDYCLHCFHDGKYSNDRTIDEMIESNLRFLDEYNAAMGQNYSKEEARVELVKFLSTLKRWQ